MSDARNSRSAINFTLDGRGFVGRAGDTLAAALLASGGRVLGRSFKYHRPRGLWGSWVEEPNVLFDVTLGAVQVPNCQATTPALVEGMALRSIGGWPSARVDLKAGLDLFSRFLPAGFYYKTFMWPNWHLFEPLIRKIAGLGRLNIATDRAAHAAQSRDRCDVLVAGVGLAGLAAACAAAESGRDTVLVDDRPQIGGATCGFADQIEGQPFADWQAATYARFIAAGGRYLPATTAFGIYDHGMVGLATLGGFTDFPRLTRMRSTQVVMATGAMDRPLTCANNDRPGIMSAQAALEYHQHCGVEALQAFVPEDGPAGISAVGAAAGVFDAEAAIAHARTGGAAPMGGIGLHPVWSKPGQNGRQWVDLQGDMTLKDISLARVSFTRDASYEISVPSSLAEPLWAAVWQRAGARGLVRIGVEALSILRAEKGYVIIGVDTDGETMPHDIGFGGPRLNKPGEFVGKRGLFTEVAAKANRRQLVGLAVPDGAARLATGAHVVTSPYHSPTLQSPIALALLEDGQNRIGQSVQVRHFGKLVAAKVVSTVCYDPEGERLNV